MPRQTRITRRARAKINLSLHVTGQRADGYHLLDSLVAFADVSDVVTVTAADAVALRVTGPLAQGVPTDGSNLILKAVALMGKRKGADIHLEKHLPKEAGIGGGSADAAAALRALSELWECELPDDIVTLGADVPVCLSPVALRMEGIGDSLSPVERFPEVWAVLVNPRVGVPTPEVFKALSEKSNAPMPEVVPSFEDAGDLCAWLVEQRNDLETPAIEIAPVISDVLDALSPSLLARMSGSGATCFGICTDEAAANVLAGRITRLRPEWWVVPTRLS